VPYRQVFSRKNDKEWSFRWELNPQGTWLGVSEVTCKR
jgi:hypothetical protein